MAGATEKRAALVRSMSNRIIHRGPDERGFYESQHVALGVRRLSVQDVAHGQQPVASEDGTVQVVFNGELYNVHRLQRRLRGRGHKLRSGSDTECIPHLYEEYGLDFVQHLHGMFAVALWDAKRERLVLARDRLGKKPLYYSEDPGELKFASEMKSLLADPSLDRTPDHLAIHHYLTLQYVPAPWSALRSVRKLEPGHMLVKSRAGLSTIRYWRPEYPPNGMMVPLSDRELAGQLRERLMEAVRIRMISERPLGAFLSGGLDSSAIVASMHHLGVTAIKTFSIGFEEETHNELPHAARVAQRYETEHHEYVVKPDVQDLVPRLARYFDEPYADSSAIPSWYLADLASKHVVVALNGDGGDEALGGYGRYAQYLAGPNRRLPNWVAEPMRRTGYRLRPYGKYSPTLRKAASAAIRFGESDPARRYARFLSYFAPEEKVGLYTQEFMRSVNGCDTYDLLSAIWDEYSETDRVNRLLAVDTLTYLPGDLLPKVDITTMSVSLEARSPFLDQDLVAWVAAIPGDRKMALGNSKAILKGALRGWLDEDLINRRKQGFAIPLAQWLRGPLREMVFDVLTDETAKSRGYFQHAAVVDVISDHMSGVDRSSQLYALLMLELWHREALA